MKKYKITNIIINIFFDQDGDQEPDLALPRRERWLPIPSQRAAKMSELNPNFTF